MNDFTDSWLFRSVVCWGILGSWLSILGCIRLFHCFSLRLECLWLFAGCSSLGYGIKGWCAGRNPPFVQWRHSAKRATRACGKTVISAYLPFHPAGQSFHRLSSSILNNNASSRTAEWHVSFLFCRQCSRTTPFTGVAGLPGGRSFLKRSIHRVRKPSASSPTHAYKNI